MSSHFVSTIVQNLFISCLTGSGMGVTGQSVLEMALVILVGGESLKILKWWLGKM